jgi:hypothetical protein
MAYWLTFMYLLMVYLINAGSTAETATFSSGWKIL